MSISSLIALGISTVMVVGLVVGLGVLSLLFGTGEFFFGKPRFTFLRTSRGENGFSFHLAWNSSKEPGKIDKVKVRLFNPFGSPTQGEVTKTFDAKSGSFGVDLDMGAAFGELLKAKGVDKASVSVELISNDGGLSFTYDFKGERFLKLLKGAHKSINDFADSSGSSAAFYHQNQHSMIAESVPGKEKHLVLPTNPEFIHLFNPGGGSGGSADGAAEAEQFSVSKVWIEDGCIVCNACEDIYPEVFEVTQDSCIIRAGAPLDDGLKILEASDACPVEVIKYNKA